MLLSSQSQLSQMHPAECLSRKRFHPVQLEQRFNIAPGSISGSSQNDSTPKLQFEHLESFG
eukprot:759388-Rhodomonas_salina.1